MPFRLRRHAPHEVALGGGIAVAVVFVRLPQREFEPFILGGQVGAKVEMIAEEHLVGVARQPEMQMEHFLRKPLGRIAAVERDAPRPAAHADVAACWDNSVEALKRRRVGRFEHHVHGGLCPDALDGRAAYVREPENVAARQPCQQPRLLLRILLPPFIPMRHEHDGEQRHQFRVGQFFQRLHQGISSPR